VKLHRANVAGLNPRLKYSLHPRRTKLPDDVRCHCTVTYPAGDNVLIFHYSRPSKVLSIDFPMPANFAAVLPRWI